MLKTSRQQVSVSQGMRTFTDNSSRHKPDKVHLQGWHRNIGIYRIDGQTRIGSQDITKLAVVTSLPDTSSWNRRWGEASAASVEHNLSWLTKVRSWRHLPVKHNIHIEIQQRCIYFRITPWCASSGFCHPDYAKSAWQPILDLGFCHPESIYAKYKYCYEHMWLSLSILHTCTHNKSFISSSPLCALL